jgi:hypothetical protein
VSATASLGGAYGPAALAAMDPDDFRRLVEDSVGNHADPALWDALTDPRVIVRTRKCLGAIHQDLEAQLALRNADLEEFRSECFARGEEGKHDFFARKAEDAEWRRRVTGYRRMVQRRIALVDSSVYRPAHPPAGTGTRKQNQAALEVLTRAVMEHRRAVTSGRGDESDDQKLWACLEQITAATAKGGEMPLAEWLEYLEDVRENEGGDR